MIQTVISTSAELDRFRFSNHSGTWIVRGRCMESAQSLFREISAALQFPSYFGMNWDALDECLCDLEWLGPPAIVTLVFSDAHRILASEPDKRAVLVEVLASAQSFWAEPGGIGEDPGQRPVDLRLIFGTATEGDVWWAHGEYGR